MQPNFSPNTVNQTVSYNGRTFRGQPGQGWQDVTAESQANDAKQAQVNYQAAIGTAVAGLQGAGTTLDDQYKTLLGDVLGQGTVAMNTATRGENNLLAQRGITNNSPLYDQQMTAAQLPVTAQNQSAVGNLGYNEGQLQTNLAAQIAQLQAGGAGTASQMPLQYGQLALQQAALPSQIALNTANANQVGGQNALQIALQQLRNQYQVVPGGQNLVNTLANFAVNPGMLTDAGGGAAWLNNGR